MSECVCVNECVCVAVGKYHRHTTSVVGCPPVDKKFTH